MHNQQKDALEALTHSLDAGRKALRRDARHALAAWVRMVGLAKGMLSLICSLVFMPLAGGVQAASSLAASAKTTLVKKHGKRGHKLHHPRRHRLTGVAHLPKAEPNTIDAAISAAYPIAISPADTQALAAQELHSFRQAIVAYAAGFLGTRYQVGGKQPGGFDCSGFTGYIYRQFGLRLPACSGSQAAVGEALTLAEARPGDLVFFARPVYTRKKRKAAGSRVYHAAMVADTTGGRVRIIHSANRVGVTLTDLSEPGYWRTHLHSIRRAIDRPAALQPAM